MNTFGIAFEALMRLTASESMYSSFSFLKQKWFKRDVRIPSILLSILRFYSSCFISCFLLLASSCFFLLHLASFCFLYSFIFCLLFWCCCWDYFDVFFPFLFVLTFPSLSLFFFLAVTGHGVSLYSGWPCENDRALCHELHPSQHWCQVFLGALWPDLHPDQCQAAADDDLPEHLKLPVAPKLRNFGRNPSRHFGGVQEELHPPLPRPPPLQLHVTSSLPFPLFRLWLTSWV